MSEQIFASEYENDGVGYIPLTWVMFVVTQLPLLSGLLKVRIDLYENIFEYVVFVSLSVHVSPKQETHFSKLSQTSGVKLNEMMSVSELPTVILTTLAIW